MSSTNTTVTRKQAKEARRTVALFDRQKSAKPGKSGKAKTVNGIQVGVKQGVRTLRNGATMDVATGKFLTGPVKGSGTGTRRKTRKGTTSRRVQVAPTKGHKVSLTKLSRRNFVAAAAKDGHTVFTGQSTKAVAAISVLGLKGVPQGYTPKGFVIGDGYKALVKDLSKSEAKALLV